MRIGIDISQIVYQTGVSRYTAELVENLLKIDQKNQYVLYAGSLRQRQILKAFVAKLPRKVKLVLSPFSPKIADLIFNRCNLPINRLIGNVNVFHASNWMIPKIECPIVTTIHDLTFLKFPEEHLPYYIAAHKRHLFRAKKAQVVITVSQATKRDLINEGFATDKIHVVYEAAGSMFKPVKAAVVKAKYQLTKPFILSVGTREPRKNIKRLIQAYTKLFHPGVEYSNTPGCELAIVGKFGWGEKTQVLPGIKLLGFVPDEDLAGLYSGAQAFVYPSLYEGFGLPVVEALSCGCPVVTSNVSSLPEIGGEAAIYVDPLSVAAITSGIKTALESTSKLRRLGLEQAKKFSWENTARETLKIYEKVYADRY